MGSILNNIITLVWGGGGLYQVKEEGVVKNVEKQRDVI